MALVERLPYPTAQNRESGPSSPAALILPAHSVAAIVGLLSHGPPIQQRRRGKQGSGFRTSRRKRCWLFQAPAEKWHVKRSADMLKHKLRVFGVFFAP